MSSNTDNLIKNIIEERVIMRGLKEVKTKGIESYGIFYPLQYGFEFSVYTNVRAYLYLDIHNITRRVHEVVNMEDKDKYMKDKKYKYVGVVWKFIESVEPKKSSFLYSKFSNNNFQFNSK